MKDKLGTIHLGLRLCFMLLIAALATGCVKDDYFTELQEMSVQMDKMCPMVIDGGTRLDSTSAKEAPLTLVYYYTATTASKDALPENIEEVKAQLKKQAQDNLDNASTMEAFRKMDVALTYDYRDKNGEYLFNYTVAPTKK
ncbi:hypothetical protein FMM05_04145 [Flavobacterium zepuense]|uniref:Lipoprotein n=1 Tax=Flavobacterium zepuense TaxID=2593302 RepID=A0A552V7Z0_9FLAO|nr:hypothetical protein [Flavobacterium zepuense]TRW26577.1 hypothetical protein FMM05_04145 [Flavobacterium zepuense]